MITLLICQIGLLHILTYFSLPAVFEEISDDDKAFEHCIEDIILKLSNVETMTDANKATRCEFISAILHTSIAIAKKLTSQDIFIVLQKDISGEDSTGRVDYAIKALEDLLCITEGKPRNIKIGYAQVRLLHRSVFFRRFNINTFYFS